MKAIHLFTLRNIPVYVQPWYFILLAFFCFQGSWTDGLIFSGCVTLSLLVHEFGHATVAAKYRLNPTVILHGWGGMCTHERAEKDSHDAFIVASGPGAGFAFGLIVLGLMMAMPMTFLDTRPILAEVLVNLVWINLVWSVLNMLPLWPLDGGQLARLLILRLTTAATGEKITHILGIIVAIVAVALAWVWLQAPFMMLIAALLGYENLKQLRSKGPSGAIRRRYTHTNSLLEAGWVALENDDYVEAERLGYQVRAEPNLSNTLDQKAWEVIALASLLQGKIDEGLKWAERATQSPRLVAACINGHLIKGDVEAARVLSRTRAFRKLPQPVKRELHRRFEAVSGE